MNLVESTIAHHLPLLSRHLFSPFRLHLLFIIAPFLLLIAHFLVIPIRGVASLEPFIGPQ
jgi:hypothetical protein